MDPVTLTSTCVGLIAAIAPLSVQVNTFVRTVQGARNDMRDVLQELDALSLNLQALHGGSIGSQSPPAMLETLLTVLRSCDKVVEDMRALLEKLCSSRVARLRWTLGGQEDIGRLRTSLESYKSTIMISLQIGSIATREPNMTRFLGEVSDLRRRLDERDHVEYSLPMQRFLEESVSYAETLLDTEDSASAEGGLSGADVVAEVEDDHQTTQITGNTIAFHRALFTLRGDLEYISELIFSPDSALLAATDVFSPNAGIRMWRMSTGELEATIPAEYPSALAFSSNGRMLAVGLTRPYSLKIWNVLPSPLIRQSSSRLGGSVTTIAFAPDDKTLAFGCSDGNVRLLEVASGVCHTLLPPETSQNRVAVHEVRFSSSGRFLAHTSHTKTVQLWDLQKGNKYSELTGCYGYIVAFSLNEQFLASVGRRDGTVALWNVAQAALHATLHGHTSNVRSVEFFDDSMTLISTSLDGTAKLWDVRTGQQKTSIAGRDLRYAVICTSRRLLVGEVESKPESYAMFLRQLPTGSLLAAFKGYGESIYSRALIKKFDPSGRRLVSGHRDGSIRIWDTECKPDTVEGSISTEGLF